jgi:hypothetical protein
MKIKIFRESFLYTCKNKILLEYGFKENYLMVDLDRISYCLQSKHFKNLRTDEIESRLKEAHEKIKEKLSTSTNTDIKMKDKFVYYVDINDNTIKNTKFIHKITLQELNKAFEELKEKNNKRGIDAWLWKSSHTIFKV